MATAAFTCFFEVLHGLASWDYVITAPLGTQLFKEALKVLPMVKMLQKVGWEARILSLQTKQTLSKQNIAGYAQTPTIQETEA